MWIFFLRFRMEPPKGNSATKGEDVKNVLCWFTSLHNKTYIWISFQKYPKPFHVNAAVYCHSLWQRVVLSSFLSCLWGTICCLPHFSLSTAFLNFSDDPTCFQWFQDCIATCLYEMTDPCSHFRIQFLNVCNLKREMNNDSKIGKLRNVILYYWSYASQTYV